MTLRKLSSLAALLLGPLAGSAWAQEAAENVKGAPPPPPPAAAAAPVVPEACGCACDCKGGCVSVGAAFYLLRPHFENNPAYVTALQDPAITNNTNRSTTETDFDYDYTFSPLIWVGYTGANGLGARVRWFHFDQSADPIAVAVNDPSGFTTVRSAAPLGLNFQVPSSGNLISEVDIASDLKMDVLDLEATQEFNLERCAVLVSGGVRYAHLDQNYAASFTRTNTNNGRTRLGGLESGHNFDGVGPTASIDLSRTLGRTSVALYVNARGSVLLGDSKQAVFLNLLNGTGVTTDASSSVGTHEDVIPVGELEVGARWSRSVGSGVAFLGASFVAQAWVGAGNAANNDLLGGAAGQTDEVSTTHGTLGLIGLKVEGGFRY